MLEWRERVRLYKTLFDQRTQWIQRIHAELFQHGVAVPEGEITFRIEALRAAHRSGLAVSPAARQRIGTGYSMIDATDSEAQPLRAQLTRFGTRQAACRALVDAHFGIGRSHRGGHLVRARRLSAFLDARQVVRHAGLDITVDSSDTSPGQRPSDPPRSRDSALGALRAAKFSSRGPAPDHAYYASVKSPTTASLLLISMARKLVRRCYHTLRNRRSRGGLRHSLSVLLRISRHRRSGPLTTNTTITRGCQLPPTAVPASTHAGRPSNTEPTALPITGVIQSRLLSPTAHRDFDPSSTSIHGLPLPQFGPREQPYS